MGECNKPLAEGSLRGAVPCTWFLVPDKSFTRHPLGSELPSSFLELRRDKSAFANGSRPASVFAFSYDVTSRRDKQILRFFSLALILLPPESTFNLSQEGNENGTSVENPVREHSIPYHKQG